jgi:hypothetical protein
MFKYFFLLFLELKTEISIEKVEKSIKALADETNFHVETCEETIVLFKTLSQIDTEATIKNIRLEDLSIEFQILNWIKNTPVFTEFNHFNLSIPHMKTEVLNVSLPNFLQI